MTRTSPSFDTACEPLSVLLFSRLCVILCSPHPYCGCRQATFFKHGFYHTRSRNTFLLDPLTARGAPGKVFGNMAALGQTIAVFDKSGKAVSTSKHLINVFKEAKLAYRERKAEIVAGRQADLERKHKHRIRSVRVIDDEADSTTSSRRSPRSPRTPRHSSRAGPSHRHNPLHRSETSPLIGSPRSPTSSHRTSRDCGTPPPDYHHHHKDLIRRHSATAGFPSELPPRPRSADGIDLDLAYGDPPPDLFSPANREHDLQVTTYADEAEIHGLVAKVKMLLEEADCLQVSAGAMITSLQKNPDAMAAVALTLAEISNVAKRLAPGALMAMKSSSPAVFALLASPQFLIAAGVGVGLTVVCLGGYKIVKRIKLKNEAAAAAASAEDAAGMDEMLEIGGQVSTIESWRQGIELAEEQEPGSTVEGEFITPTAAALSRLNLNETGNKEGKKKQKKTRTKKSTNERSKTAGEGGSETSSKKAKEESKKPKRPSRLRLTF